MLSFPPFLRNSLTPYIFLFHFIYFLFILLLLKPFIPLLYDRLHAETGNNRLYTLNPMQKDKFIAESQRRLNKVHYHRQNGRQTYGEISLQHSTEIVYVCICVYLCVCVCVFTPGINPRTFPLLLN